MHTFVEIPISSLLLQSLQILHVGSIRTAGKVTLQRRMTVLQKCKCLYKNILTFDIAIDPGNIADAIEFDFGGFDNLKKQMEEASLALFGSGWVWLAQEENGRLRIVSCKNGDTPARKGMTPLLGFDVWEHAYYLDYQNRRADFIRQWWDIVDWKKVDSRMDISF